MCLCTDAIFNAHIFYLKTFHLTLGVVDSMANNYLLSSLRSFTIGITYLSASDSPVYSESVIDSMISFFNWDFCTKLHPDYLFMYPRLDRSMSLFTDSYLS